MSAQGKTCGLTMTGYGMWTAVGTDGPSSVMAMRSTVSGASRSGLWDRTTGDFISACRVGAHQWWEGPGFLPHLLAPVIAQCRADLAARTSVATAAATPVLVAVAPPDRPTRPEGFERMVQAALGKLCDPVLPKGSAILPAGRVALALMLARVEEAGWPRAILVGAESFLRQEIADVYDEQGRMLSGRNTSGFIPGEASAGIVVEARARGGLRLRGIGIASDPSGAGGRDGAPSDGSGLTQAMRAALGAAKREFHDINVLMGDLNGEHFKFKEAAIASTRLDRVPPEGESRRPRGYVEHWNVVETTGETGAALLPSAMGWAFEAGRGGWLPGGALFFAGEDDGRRVAVTGEWAA